MARVLVVEDDTALSMLLTYLLGLEGHDVEVIDDGAEAMARLDGDVPDAVFLDVMLPGGHTGLDVLRALRQRSGWRHIPAIVVSALSTDEHQWKGWTAGATAYVTKPYDGDQLLEVLREALAATAPARL